MSGTCTLGSITLPADIEWEDEGAWMPAAAIVRTSVTGAQIIQASAQQSGRPITLVARGDGHVWVDYALVQTLRTAAAENLGTPMTLTLIDGREFSVLWRHADLAVEYSPVEYSTSANTETRDARPYKLTIRLIQV